MDTVYTTSVIKKKANKIIIGFFLSVSLKTLSMPFGKNKKKRKKENVQLVLENVQLWIAMLMIMKQKILLLQKPNNVVL